MAAENRQETLLDGVFIKAAVSIQCGRCAEQGRQTELIVQVENTNLADAGNVDEFLVPCKVCSQELGVLAGVNFSVVVGAQLEDEDEVDEASEGGG